MQEQRQSHELGQCVHICVDRTRRLMICKSSEIWATLAIISKSKEKKTIVE